MAFNLKGLLQDEEFLLGAGLLTAGSKGQSLSEGLLPSLIQAGKIKKAFTPTIKKFSSSSNPFKLNAIILVLDLLVHQKMDWQMSYFLLNYHLQYCQNHIVECLVLSLVFVKFYL